MIISNYRLVYLSKRKKTYLTMSFDNIFALATLPKSIAPSWLSDSEFVRCESFRSLRVPFLSLLDDGRPLDGFTYVPLNSNFLSSTSSTAADSFVFFAPFNISSSLAILFATLLAETTLVTRSVLADLLQKYRLIY